MISGLVIVVIGQEERLGRDRVRLASSHNKGLVRSPGAMLGQSKGASTARLDLVGTHRQPEGKACDVVEGNYSQLSVVLTNGRPTSKALRTQHAQLLGRILSPKGIRAHCCCFYFQYNYFEGLYRI